MVSQRFIVEHDHCSLCRKSMPLFVLALRAGERPELVAKPENMHSGICQQCWATIAEALMQSFALGDGV